jgi:hypothetical protein
LSIYRRPAPVVSVNLGQGLDVGAANGGSAAGNATKRTSEVVAGICFFIIGWVIALIIKSDAVFTPPDGIGAFALFFVAAAAIERFTEFAGPAIEWLLTKLPPKRDTKTQLRQQLHAAIATADNSTVQPEGDGTGTPQKDAADAQAKVDEVTQGRTAALAGFAGGLGIILADVLNANFLVALGISQVNAGLALAVTGLVVAGGTKQLHDLITYVSKSKDQQATPPQTGGTGS